MTVESEERINDFLKKHNVKHNVIKGYGMTELSSVIGVNLDNESNKIGSTGIPFPKNTIKVLDHETHEKKQVNEIGEIYVLSPSRMKNYLNNDNEYKNVISVDENGNCWVKTGDRGYIDEDGFIFIDGRYKNMIVRPDGHNVFPTTISDVINKHPAVDKSVVVGVKQHENANGEIPTACVVLKSEFKGRESEILDEIKKKSAEELPPRDVALAYYFFDEIPMTSNGKIDDVLLKQIILQQQKNNEVNKIKMTELLQLREKINETEVEEKSENKRIN